MINQLISGLLVRTYREMRGMTRDELAGAACLSEDTIKKIEFGVRGRRSRGLTPSTAIRIADALRVPRRVVETPVHPPLVLRTLREIEGYSRSRLAALTDINEADIAAYETGRQPMDDSTVDMLARLFNVPHVLLTEIEQREAHPDDSAA